MSKAILSILGTITFGAVLILSMGGFFSWNPQQHNSLTDSDSANSATVFDSAKELSKFLHTNNYHWPITKSSSIPELYIESVPEDLQTLPKREKKTLFLRILLPIVLAEQKLLREKRQFIESIFNNQDAPLNAESSPWFANLVREYRVSRKLDVDTQKSRILEKVDELPVTLVLAQAAIESGWGTSRFAIEGNSLFGEWTFERDRGLVPNERQDGKSHKIKTFATIAESVRSYVKNINRNQAYKELREIRSQMRQQNQNLDASKLADGLKRYSQKGEAYVLSVKQLLKSPEFKLLESLNLQPEAVASSI